MNKKLMLLAAGALTALAFAVLPAVASAAEFEAHCSTGPVCAGTIAGGEAVLQDDSGGIAGRIHCTTTTGTATQNNTSSTGTRLLTFDGCTNAVDGRPCWNEGTTAEQKIVTNQLVSHLVYIDSTAEGTLVGVLLTGVNVTIACDTILGEITKTVTGNIIGQITNPNCKVAKPSYANLLSKVNSGEAASPQKWMQVTTTGPKFDLTSGTHPSDGTTTTLTVSYTITYTPTGTNVTLTC